MAQNKRHKTVLSDEQKNSLTNSSTNSSSSPSTFNKQEAQKVGQQQIEQALRESQEALQALLNAIQESVFLMEPDGTFIHANETVARRLGTTVDKLIGISSYDFLPSEVASERKAFVEQVVQTGQPVRFEDVRNGRHIDNSIYPILDDAGNVNRLAIVGIDMTTQKRTQEQLQASREWFRMVADFTHDWEYWLSTDGYYLYVSPSCEKITGYRPEEFMTSDGLFGSIVHVDDCARVAQNIEEVMLHQKSDTLRFRIITRSGEERWIDHVCLPVYAEDGTWLGIRGSNRDITDQVRAEEALLESEEYYRLMAENATDMISRHAPDGTFLYVSPACVSLLGYSSVELVGQSCYAFFHAEDLARIAESHTAIVEQPTISTISYRMQRKDGSYIWIETTSKTIRDADSGEVTEIIAVSRDISERKRIEKELEQSLLLVRATIESTSDGIVVGSQDGEIVTFNKKFQKLWNLPDGWHTLPDRSRRIGLVRDQIKDPERFINWFAQLNSIPDAEGHLLIELNDTRVFESFSTPYCFGETIAGRVWSYRDVTERVRAETELRESKQELQRANQQLQHVVDELQQRNYHITLLNDMGNQLNSCQTIEEGFGIIEPFMPQLFPEQTGVLYLQTGDGTIQPVITWGEDPPAFYETLHPECWVLNHHQHLLVEHAQSTPQCECSLVGDLVSNGFPYICVPMIAHGETMGILHLYGGPPSPQSVLDLWKQLAITTANKLALELTDLQLRERMRQQSIRDPLTGLFNRRYLDETIQRELKRALRTRQPIGVIMFDIDHFKRFNDTYGHDGGDTLLRHVGALLQTNIRQEDIACRYGGEEFTLILPGATLQQTVQRAEELRLRVADLYVQHHGQSLGTVTASLGVSCFPEHGSSDEQIIKAADQALYAAKRGGRNRVVAASTYTPE